MRILIVDLVPCVQDGREPLEPLRVASPRALIVVHSAQPSYIPEDGARATGADLFIDKSLPAYEGLASRLPQALGERGP